MTLQPAVLNLPLRMHGGESRLARTQLGLFGWTVDAPGVPVGLCYFDFQQRVVSLNRFVRLTGNVEADFAAFADYLSHRVGCKPALASPIRPRP